MLERLLLERLLDWKKSARAHPEADRRGGRRRLAGAGVAAVLREVLGGTVKCGWADGLVELDAGLLAGAGRRERIREYQEVAYGAAKGI